MTRPLEWGEPSAFCGGMVGRITSDGIAVFGGGFLQHPASDGSIHRVDKQGKVTETRIPGAANYDEWKLLFRDWEKLESKGQNPWASP